ncbi:hypothetical protein [Salinibaculum rarum]|uniref:hypothetical protein n=1 Tax=Salinibaculum rarum TaxID=3058903 RepID=UPI00265F3225|nr:hypothetical protein [Salinibaculum sp. KK48]
MSRETATGDEKSMEVPVEIGEFEHREVPNPQTTTWRRIWGVGELGDYPCVGTTVSITTATSEHWQVRRTHHLYKESTTKSSFPWKSGSPDGTQSLLSATTLSEELPSREAALDVALDVMNAANTIDPLIPPAMNEKLAVAYCREQHPDHELANRTVQKSELVAEATDLDAEDPIGDRLETIEEVYDDPVTLADNFVDSSDDENECEGDTELLSAFSWMESWESRGFDVRAEMPATREIIVRHPDAGEKFKIREISDAKRGSVFKLSATVNGEYVEQHGRSKMRESFAVALRDLSRLMRAEIGDKRYYHR